MNSVYDNGKKIKYRDQRQYNNNHYIKQELMRMEGYVYFLPKSTKQQ